MVVLRTTEPYPLTTEITNNKTEIKIEITIKKRNSDEKI